MVSHEEIRPPISRVMCKTGGVKVTFECQRGALDGGLKVKCLSIRLPRYL